jgi:hypothetical protein
MYSRELAGGFSSVVHLSPTMESVYQDEAVYSEPQQLTPEEQLRLQWRQQPGFIAFIRQKNVIDQNVELVPHAGTAGLIGWIPPLAFALQGLVLISFIATVVNWQLTRHAGKMEEQIVALQAGAQAEINRQEIIIAATQAEIARISSSPHSVFKLHISPAPLSREEALRQLNNALADSERSEDQYKQSVAAQEHRLRARQSALAIANSGTPAIFSLALVLAAGLVGKGVQKDFLRIRQGRRAKDFYLYFATAEGLWANLVLLTLLHVVFSRSAYGLSDTFDRVGPLFWVVFCAAFYFLLLRLFAAIARDVYRALEIRIPDGEWSVENRMLLRIHNSFFLVFAAVEAGFLALCYALYLAQRVLI